MFTPHPFFVLDVFPILAPIDTFASSDTLGVRSSYAEAQQYSLAATLRTGKPNLGNVLICPLPFQKCIRVFGC